MKRQRIESWEKHAGGTTAGLSKKRGRIGRLSLLSALLLAVWIFPALAEEPPGKDLGLFYQQNCARCHGADGSAMGADGKKLKGHDLTDERWQRNTDDGKMVKAILNGKFFGRAMPKFKDVLSEAEAHRMVTDIIRKSIKGKAIGPKSTGPAGE